MSELNDLIKMWRRSLGDFSLEQADELEDSLRQDAEALQGLGLSPQEAFKVATMRLGPPMELSVEFSRANGLPAWRYRLHRSLQPVAVLVPVLFSIATFYRSRVISATESSVAEAFAALVWLALLHLPLYFMPRFQQRTWLARATMAGLLLVPAIVLAVVVGSGILQLSSWISFAGAAAWGAQNMLALASLLVHGLAISTLLWPNKLLEHIMPAI